jgi:lipoprotein signal peptidase
VIRRCAAFLAIALGGAGLDLAAKAWVFAHYPSGSTTWLIPRLLAIQPATNAGIAWGLFPSRAWGWVSLLAAPLIAAAFLGRKSRGERLCGALILAGTIGNGWDRLFLHSVRDFLLVPVIPNFNLADAMLTCSVAALSLIWILHDRRPVDQARPADALQPDDGGLGDIGRNHGPRPGRP